MSHPLRVAGLLALVLIMGVVPAAAAVFTSNTADFEPRLRTGGTITPAGPYDPGPSTTATSLRVGFQTNFQITTAYFFQLPVLSPGQAIIGADFSVSELPDSAATALVPTFNGDLVALGFTNTDPPANTAAESQAYFFLGEGATDTGADRLLIQDNFLVPSDFIASGGTAATKSTSALGDLALLTYINALYANQATNGFVPGTSYLILRVNPDVTSASGTMRYTLASADNITPDVTLPTLTLNVVPEPSSSLLLALGALGLIGGAVRSRKQRRSCR